MAATVGGMGIHASRDLLVMHADVQLTSKNVKQLIVEFDQQAFDAFNAGNMKAATSGRPFQRVRPATHQVPRPALIASPSNAEMTSENLQEGEVYTGVCHHIFFA